MRTTTYLVILCKQDKVMNVKIFSSLKSNIKVLAIRNFNEIFL